MQNLDEEVLYSASDLVNYLEFEHLTSLDLIDCVFRGTVTGNFAEA
jgi:hypothetical protein